MAEPVSGEQLQIALTMAGRKGYIVRVSQPIRFLLGYFMRNHFIRLLAVGLAVAFVGEALAQPGIPDLPTYRNGGFSALGKMGMALFKAMRPVFKEQVHFAPVSMEKGVMPYVRLDESQDPDIPKPMRRVFISDGLADLVNNVAHAKAIDKIEKGFFEKYVISLSQETGEKELRELPKLADKRYWTDDIMNEQESNFSQIAGTVLAIELSHHYLGHYKKYAERLKDPQGNPVPINSLLTEAEWQNSVKAGALNALNCGYGVEGIKVFYDCIEKMPKRPPWTVYFLPSFAKVSKLKKDLQRIEDYFFAGKTE